MPEDSSVRFLGSHAGILPNRPTEFEQAVPRGPLLSENNRTLAYFHPSSSCASKWTWARSRDSSGSQPRARSQCKTSAMRSMAAVSATITVSGLPSSDGGRWAEPCRAMLNSACATRGSLGCSVGTATPVANSHHTTFESTREMTPQRSATASRIIKPRPDSTSDKGARSVGNARVSGSLSSIRR